MKEILVLPISGGSFHIQLFLMIKLIESKYKKPNMILGTSGGSFNSYLLAASNWEINKIKMILRYVNSDIYCKSWWIPPLDRVFSSYLLSWFKGSIYNHNDKMKLLLNNVFNTHTIQEIEIWTLKVNYKNLKGCLSCNKETSILNLDDYNKDTKNIEDVKFNKGNVEDIIDDCIASGSIPTLVPAKDGYIDGGMLYASPISPLCEVINKSFDRFHIMYVNSCDMEDNSINNSYTNILNNTKNILNNIMLGPSLQDRINTINLLGSNIIYENGSCNTDKLEEILERRYNYYRSVIEIYPNSYIHLDISNFGIKNFNEDYDKFNESGFSYRLWHT